MAICTLSSIFSLVIINQRTNKITLPHSLYTRWAWIQQVITKICHVHFWQEIKMNVHEENTELRKLDFLHVEKLSRFLDIDDVWKRLMSEIPVHFTPFRSSEKRFNYNDIRWKQSCNPFLRGLQNQTCLFVALLSRNHVGRDLQANFFWRNGVVWDSLDQQLGTYYVDLVESLSIINNSGLKKWFKF